MIVDRKKLELGMANARLNPEDLAVKANMPRPTLGNALIGRNVRPASIGKIACALGVPVEQIVKEGVRTMSKDPRKITIAEVARHMGKAQTYVRACLIAGRLPFGSAVKRPGSSKWSFHIVPEAFE